MAHRSRLFGWIAASALVAILAHPGALSAQPVEGPTADDLFNDAVLHDLHLFIHSKDWEKLIDNFLTNTYYPCDMQWRDQTIRNVGIRSRGYGSRSDFKPGLRVDFDRYAADQEFLGLKSFVLDNLRQDPSGVKERVTMKLFRRLGIPAPREVHARVFINGNYLGVYAIVESIDKAFLKRAFGVNEFGSVENDGYLYEYNWKDNWRFEYLGADLVKYAEHFDPKTHESAPGAVLYGPIEEMVRTINEAPDASFVADVAQYLDWNRLLMHVAVESYLAESDGILGAWGLNNFYFYRFEQKRLAQLLPWDKDSTFWDVGYSIYQGAEENGSSAESVGRFRLRELTQRMVQGDF